ncbi:MAG: N-acetyltransferase [Pseudomonadota bacterium]
MPTNRDAEARQAWNIVPLSPDNAAEAAHLNRAHLPTRWTKDDFHRAIADPDMLCLISAAAGTDTDTNLIGLVLARRTVDDGEILSLVVDPHHRRGGLATCLMQRACIGLMALGAQRVLLEVASDNAPAITLYTSLGFRDIGTRIGYYSRGETSIDARIMAWRPDGAEESSE